MKAFKPVDLLAYLTFTLLAAVTPAVGAWIDGSRSTEFMTLATAMEQGVSWSVWTGFLFATLAMVAWGNYSARRKANPALGVWGLVGALVSGLFVASWLVVQAR